MNIQELAFIKQTLIERPMDAVILCSSEDARDGVLWTQMSHVFSNVCDLPPSLLIWHPMQGDVLVGFNGHFSTVIDLNETMPAGYPEWFKDYVSPKLKALHHYYLIR